MRLRVHQRAALDALEAAWAGGRDRAWVVLPPGAGKTLVGCESVRRLLAAGEIGRGVVLGPNTAIQGQWVRAAAGAGLAAGTDRDLGASLTALTYQSLAVFDTDAEVDAGADGAREVGVVDDGAALVDRLHENGRALVERLRAAGPILLVLDECHHLLEVWGRLLAELLEDLPEARVLGLTATPPAALSADQAALVGTLFGEVVHESSIPAVVREGDLAPYAELVWLTTPTPTERDWLAEGAARFAELTSALCAPGFGSTGFLTWLDLRFVDRGDPGARADPGWPALVRAEPDLCAAALRLHHVGLLALPPGARLTEEHRVAPGPDDWMLLVDDWLRCCLADSGDPADVEVVAAVRRALPAVGWVWTRRGPRRGRTPVDRVLARSAAKTTAATVIAEAEQRALGETMRLLVLCDHERAGATLPVDLEGVLDQQAGSALAVLDALLAAPAGADAVLVTGRTVAAAPETLRRLVAHVGLVDPRLAVRLVVTGGPGRAELTGAWTSRVWVRHVTTFFEAGGTHVLVGTRGLLGEGWDAPCTTGLVDLTAITTTTAVVQTRGRALRTDPTRPDKVALNWSVVCLDDEHPRGDNDWRRVVRKHDGFFGVDAAGQVVDGVAHLDPTFSPYAAPAAADIDAVNARMLVRAEDRDAIRERWAVGTPYDDRAARALRIRPRRAAGRPDLTAVGDAPVVVQGEAGLEVREGAEAPTRGLRRAERAAWLAGGLVLAAAVLLGSWWVLLALLPVALLGAGLALARDRELVVRGRRLLSAATAPVSVALLAAAVADGLHTAGLVTRGADAVEIRVEPDGGYRCVLAGVAEVESRRFAEALDELVSPLGAPRYVVPRWVALPADGSAAEARRVARGEPRPAAHVAWHAVPALLGTNAERARAFAAAWSRWVGGGAALHTGSPEGAGVLAAQQGADPLDVVTVVRRVWS